MHETLPPFQHLPVQLLLINKINATKQRQRQEKNKLLD